MLNYDTKRKSVLIIEDDEDFRKVEVSFFENSGYNVVTSDNGVDALTKTSNQSFDLIVCDLTMPRMTGDQAVDIINKSTLNKDTPIIILSGNISREVIEKLKGKVHKAFTKPANMFDVVKYADGLFK